MNQEQVEKAVDDALKEREKKFINEVKPRFKVMFAGMGGELDKGWNPETIEELIQPLTNIINDVSAEWAKHIIKAHL